MLRRFLGNLIRIKSINAMFYLIIMALVFYVGQYISSTGVVQDSCECNKISKRSPDYMTELTETGIVEEKSFKKKNIHTFLLVIVLTSPKNIDQRNAMRSTWLDLTKLPTVSRRFVIGTADLDNDVRQNLDQEQNIYKDLLFLPDLKDEYSHLTQKLLHALLWANENIDFSFLFKCDDDTFARVDVIEQELHLKYNGLDNLYWGFHRGSARVKYSGQWAEHKWILCDHYLPYAVGGGYILSMKLVEYIANISSIVMLFNSEDVSLGAWLSPLKLTRIHDTRFDTEYKSRGCRNVHIVSHKQSILEMQEKSAALKNHQRLCVKETFLRASYNYEWNVPPSQCCLRRNGIP